MFAWYNRIVHTISEQDQKMNDNKCTNDVI